MRLKKCLVILLLLALTLSGCNDTVVSETTSESESSEASATSKEEVTELHNYTLNINLIYDGTTVQVPSYISLYVYGNLTGNEYKALDSDNKVTIETINVGSQGFTLYGAYTDSSDYTQLSDRVSFEVTSSQGDNYINNIDVPLLDSLDNLLPPLTEGGEGEESSESTTENPGTGEGSGGDSSSGSGSGNPEEPGAGGNSSSSENPGTGEGSSSDSSSGSGSGNPEEPGTGDSSSSSEDKGTGESSSGDSSSGTGEGGDLGGSETFTYSIDVDNITDNTIALSYDSALDTQVGVTLSIKLVTTSSVSGSTSADATANDVTFTDYDTSLIAFDGLTVYPLTATSSETSFKIVWTAGECAEYGPITVSITDDTQQPAESVTNYTLSFTFTLEANGTALSVPSNASLYITYGEATADFGEFKALTDGGNGAYTYTFDTINTDYYAYNIYIGYTDDTWHTADTCYQVVGNSWFTVYGTEGEGHVESIEHVVEADFSEIIPSTYTFNFAIYYDSTLQSVPEGYSIYAQGDFNGWSGFSELTAGNNGTYSLTITDVKQSGYSVQLVLGASNSTGSYDTRITADHEDKYCAIEYKTTANTTPIEVTSSSALEDIISDASEEGDGTKPNATYYSNYTLTITLYDSEGHMKQCPTGGAIYMASGINGSWNTEYDGYWNWGDPVKLNENTTDDGVTYSYTYPSVVDGETYSYNLLYASDGTNYVWDTDTLGTTDFTFTVDSGINDSYSQSIECTATSVVINSFTTVSGHDVDGYTLVFTIYDTNSQVQTCPSWGFLSLQGDFTTTAGGSWDNTYYDMTETQDQSGNTAYSVHFNSISAGNHSFNIMFTYTGESASWTPIKTSGNFSCTTADNLAPGTYYFDATGSDDIASSFPSHEGATEYNVFLCIVDTSNSDTSSINNVYVGSDDNIFPNNNQEDHNWDNVTKTTTTYNGNTAYAAYQSSIMTMYANDNHWAKFYDDNKSNYYFEFKVPDNMGTDICFVVFADCSKFDAWSDTPSTWSEVASGTWYAGTPSSVFSTGFTVS